MYRSASNLVTVLTELEHRFEFRTVMELSPPMQYVMKTSACLAVECALHWIQVVFDITPRRLVHNYRRFGGL